MNRRRMIAGATALGIAPRIRAAKPRRMKPQVGDVLAHAFGERTGVAILLEEVGAEPVQAFPMDPGSGLVRDGSLHNQIAVLRLDPGRLSGRARRYAVDVPPYAFLAYSAACTHTGCEVNGWHADTRHLVCPCHGSEFDVTDAARVINGPAPKPLAMLRVESAQGILRVVGGFSRRVGPEPP